VRERGDRVCVRRRLGQVDEQLDEAALSRGVVAEHVGKGGVTEWLREALAQSLAGASVVAQSVRSELARVATMIRGDKPQEAADDVLEQTDSLLLDQLVDHVAEDGADGVEAFVRLADVGEASVVEEDFLDDEDGDGLAQLGAGLHDAEAQRDDLSRKEEVDDLGGVVLDQGADDAQRGQTKVLERARLGGGIQEWVEEEGDVRLDMSAESDHTGIAHHSGTAGESHCAMPRTGAEPRHCTHGWKPLPSAATGSEEDTRK
jgi:hypothetical protein